MSTKFDNNNSCSKELIDVSISEMQDFSLLSSKTVTEVLMLEMKMAPTAKTYLVSGYPRNMSGCSRIFRNVLPRTVHFLNITLNCSKPYPNVAATKLYRTAQVSQQIRPQTCRFFRLTEMRKPIEYQSLNRDGSPVLWVDGDADTTQVQEDFKNVVKEHINLQRTISHTTK
ncbi:nucleotide kinase [Holotrichia oblita]|uniref:Nucleotide kinase n=1 Tax=Holotrichia oblita TaxID=644536 RepID=A0ACB9TUM2_HOLOL|nr:nucleotide kinase [Holotrichia oblita]